MRKRTEKRWRRMDGSEEIGRARGDKRRDRRQGGRGRDEEGEACDYVNDLPL